MKYADPTACPSCRSPLAEGVDTCSSCGLYLRSEAAGQVWQALKSADSWLEVARTRAAAPVPAGLAPVASADQGEPAGAWSATAGVEPYPSGLGRPATPVAPRKTVDAGTVLLVLGALFILVAGSIVSALALGVLALPVMTAVAAGLTVVADKKGLRASTETMLAITGLMGSLAVGLFAWESPGGWLLWALLGVGASFMVVELTREARNYVVPRVAAGLFAVAGSFALWALIDSHLTHPRSDTAAFWTGLAAAGLAAGLASLFHLRSIPLARNVAAVAVVGFGLFAWLAAIVALLGNPAPAELAGELQGLPFLLIGLALAGASRIPALDSRLRVGLLALALVHGFFLLWVPMVEHSARLATIFAFACALASVAWAGERWELKAGRAAGLVPLFVASTFYAGLALERTGSTLDVLYSDSHSRWDYKLFGVDENWWTFILAGLAVTAYCWLALRLREASSLQRYRTAVVATVGFLQLPILACFLAPTIATLAGSLVLAGLGIAVATRKLALPASALLLLAPAPTLLHAGAMGIVLALAGAVLLGLLAYFKPQGPYREAVWAVGLTFVFFALPLAGIQLHWDAKIHTLTTMGLCLLALGLAVALRRGLPGETGVGSEVAAALLGLTALLAAASDTPKTWLALLCLLGGVGLAAVSVLDSHRALFRYPAAALLGMAWVLRLVASDVTTPEAYTAPFALTLLAAGAYALYRRPELSSFRALSSGLSLALLPSLPWVLADPVSLRALLLGLVAMGALFVGAQLRLRAPFLLGAAVLALLALVELGPYVLMVHRWVLLGAFGILFATVGATWEARVKNGKAVAGYLEAMR